MTRREIDASELVGAEAILDYLSSQHEVYISRSTLHELRRNPKRKASCSQIVEDAKPFPARTRFDGMRAQVIADKAGVDRWVRRNLKAGDPPPASSDE